MSQANLPNITPSISVSREEALNLLLSSIAMEEIGLSHVINAEGEKLQYVLGTLPGLTGPPPTISDLLAVNNSVRSTLRDITKKEWLLQNKLDSLMTLPISVGPTGSAGPTGPAGPVGPTGATGTFILGKQTAVKKCGSLNRVFRRVDFNVFRYSAVLIGKFQLHANIAIFVYLDGVNKLNQDIPCQFVDVFVLAECC